MPTDDKTPEPNPEELLRLTSEIVAAYLGNNELPPEDVPHMIKSVHDALTALPGGKAIKHGLRAEPAVPILKSITPDYIICLEDGKKLKMLKRYLRTHYDMSPEEYREKWGLPADYPMVAPNYAAKRSEYAKQIGLGQAPENRDKKSAKSAAN